MDLGEQIDLEDMIRECEIEASEKENNNVTTTKWKDF